MIVGIIVGSALLEASLSLVGSLDFKSSVFG